MNIVKIVKIGSIVLSVAGMIGSAWASDKENKVAIANLVTKHLNK